MSGKSCEHCYIVSFISLITGKCDNVLHVASPFISCMDVCRQGIICNYVMN